MGAMTNAMGAIGGSINKVGKGVVGGARQVGGQMGVPGMKPGPQAPGAPGTPAQPGAVPAPGAAATAQPGESGAPAQATGPAGGQVGGQIAPGAGGAPPFLQGGLPGLGGMKRQLMQNPAVQNAQLTAQGALGKQPAQTTMQKMLGGGGGIWKKALMGGGGALPYIHHGGGGMPQVFRDGPGAERGQQPTAAYDGPAVGSPSWQRTQQQQPGQQAQPQGIVAPNPNFPVDPRIQF